MYSPEQIQQSELIDEAASEQLLVLDEDLCVKAASKSFYRAFHTSPGEVLGKRLADLDNGAWNVPAIQTLLNTLPPIGGETDGLATEQEFPRLGHGTMQVRARRLRGTDAQSATIVLSIRAADGLDASFREVLASASDGVIVSDLENRITFINPAAEKLTGWSKADALHKRLGDIFQIVDEQSAVIENAQGTGSIGAERAVLIAKDRSQCPVHTSAAPVVDAAGRTLGAVLFFHDVGLRRKAEQALELSEIRYRRLFEAAHDGILIINAATAKVIDVNPFMTDLLGYPHEYFLGKELWEIGVFKDAEDAKATMQKLQKAGHIRYEDHPLQHQDGRHIPVEFISNVYQEGNLEVIQCNIRDIAERKRLAEELERTRQSAEVANKAKSEFLANMSHEIRTPLTAILGFAEMQLRKSPEECAKIGCAEIIRRNSVHLLELINDILDLSKVEAGQMKVESISCDLPALLSEIISLLRPRAKEKGLGFGVTFQGPIPRLIQTDPLRLKQTLVNLLGNAVKFTETGRIDLRIMTEGSGEPNIILRLDVIDSGIGMPPEILERLFRPFTQGDESITRKFGGTGLGLAISQKLAHLMGGEITVASQPRVGSTFTLRIDAGPSAGVEQLDGLTEATLPKKANEASSPEIYLRGRILLVEDGADNQRLLRMQLSSAGGSVISAMNGQIALDLATSQPFDLILMDMQMPIMDGYAATIELRRRGVKTPIIALTAYAMAEDRAKCLAIGCDAYLSKPIEEGALLAAVYDYLGKPVPLESAGTSLAAPPPPVAGSSPESIRSTLAGDPRMREVIPAFVGRLPGKVRQMLYLLEHQDLVALQKIVHDILGTGGGYGFAPLSLSARKAQDSLRAGAALEPITSEINSLIEIMRRIEGYDESKAQNETEESTK
jgi:PAS domain S-box-containing protein